MKLFGDGGVWRVLLDRNRCGKTPKLPTRYAQSGETDEKNAV
jgi:hypothetical protein